MAKAVFNVFADPRREEYYNSDYLFTLHDVLIAIASGEDFKTNVMPEMSNCWDYDNYQVFIVDSNGNEYEISNESNLTPKELRPSHNIYKMWRAGAFCDRTKDRDFRFIPEFHELEEVKKYNEMIHKLIKDQEKMVETLSDHNTTNY